VIRSQCLRDRQSTHHNKAVCWLFSSSGRRLCLARKAQYYLNAGTQLVWLVWPTRQQIDIWEPGDTGPRRTRKVGDTLDGGAVLSGFTYPVVDIVA